MSRTSYTRWDELYSANSLYLFVIFYHLTASRAGLHLCSYFSTGNSEMILTKSSGIEAEYMTRSVVRLVIISKCLAYDWAVKDCGWTCSSILTHFLDSEPAFPLTPQMQRAKRKTQIVLSIYGSIRTGFELTIYRTQWEDANYYPHRCPASSILSISPVILDNVLSRNMKRFIPFRYKV